MCQVSDVIDVNKSPDFSFSSIARSRAPWACSVIGGCSGLKKYISDFPSDSTVSSLTLKKAIPLALKNFAAGLVPTTKHKTSINHGNQNRSNALKMHKTHWPSIKIPIKSASVPVFGYFSFLASNSPSPNDLIALADHQKPFTKTNIPIIKSHHHSNFI